MTIDLRGFTIDGVGNEIAPAVRLNRTSIVRNGIIENWGTSAVTSVSSHNRVEGIVFDFIDGPVIDCDQRLVVLDCSFRLCQPLDVENHTLIQDCRFYSMGEVIRSPAADNVALIDVTIAGQNTTEAGPVIELGNEARLHRVSVTNEGRNALRAGNNASVIDCAFAGNGSTSGGDGLQLGTRALVKGCVIAEYGGDGIVTGLAAHLEGNNVSDCDENGIVTTGSSTIIGNTVYSNGDDGIVAGFTSHVRNNTVRSHGGDGILCSTDCFIVGNQLDNDPIHVTGAGNTIDFNSVTSIISGFAIDTDSGGNRICRNTVDGIIDNSAGANIVFPVRNIGNFGAAGPWDNFTP